MRRATMPRERYIHGLTDRAGKDLVKRIKHYESVQTHPDKHISNYTKCKFCIIRGRDTLNAAPGG